MARTVKQQDAQVRLAIRTEKDAHPDISYKDLQTKFGVTYSTVILAMKRTSDEWQVMLGASGIKAKPSEQNISPSKALEKKRRGRPPRVTSSSLPETRPINATPQVTNQPLVLVQPPPYPTAWEYRAIVVRGKADRGATIYEFQDKSSAEWQPHAGPSFDEVLALFGRDGWELVNITTLNHGNQPFTGLFEIVFKRQK